MKFKELIAKHTWEELRQSMINLYYGPERIKDHYDDGKKLIRTEEEMKAYADKMMEGYEYVFTTLKSKRAYKNKDKKPWKIFVTYWDKEFDGKPLEDPYWHVDGENGDLNSDEEYMRDWYEEKKKDGTLTDFEIKHYNSPVRYAIEFQPWSQWLSMDIDKESISKCGEVNFICHCLWELTFFGFSERSVKNESNKLAKRAKAVDKQIKDGTLKTYSMEEVLEKFKSDK